MRLASVLYLLNKELPMDPPWTADHFLSVELLGTILDIERKRFERERGDFVENYRTAMAWKAEE
jgi:hypothetical protein